MSRCGIYKTRMLKYSMNKKQRELVSKYLSDMSKGLLLGVALGLASDKINLFGAIGYFVLSFYMFYVAFVIEGD